MGRRSDHSREELRALMLRAAHEHLAEVGFARFSAREVAKRVGYSIGSVYNVFGSLDALMLAVNTRTFTEWVAHLQAALAASGDDRIKALVEGYFSFAEAHPNLWMAIYDHRLPPDMAVPEADAGERAALTGLVEGEVAAFLGRPRDAVTERLNRSLIAIVHGHCSFALTGSFALLGESDAVGLALARVREVLNAWRTPGARLADGDP